MEHNQLKSDYEKLNETITRYENERNQTCNYSDS